MKWNLNDFEDFLLKRRLFPVISSTSRSIAGASVAPLRLSGFSLILLRSFLLLLLLLLQFIVFIFLCNFNRLSLAVDCICKLTWFPGVPTLRICISDQRRRRRRRRMQRMQSTWHCSPRWVVILAEIHWLQSMQPAIMSGGILISRRKIPPMGFFSTRIFSN